MTRRKPVAQDLVHVEETYVILLVFNNHNVTSNTLSLHLENAALYTQQRVVPERFDTQAYIKMRINTIN